MNKSTPIKKEIYKTDANLIFADDKVYKLFTTETVTMAVLEDLVRLDKLANSKPHYLEISPIGHTPFSTGNYPQNSLVIVMKYLPEDFFLSKLLNQEKLSKEIIELLAMRLFNFHQKNIQTDESFNGNYLFDRFFKDANLLTEKAKENKKVERFHEKFCFDLDLNKALLLERFSNRKIIEGHGDLYLDHVHFENDDITFIDFSHNTKYRFDDVSRDIAGIYLQFIELGDAGLANYFVTYYAKLSKDSNLTAMVSLQVAKMVLVKYYVSSGGFDKKHIDINALNKNISTVCSLSD